MKFYQKLYVGFKKENEYNQEDKKVDSLILGFMTPYENNKAGSKRIATVDSWARCTSMVINLDSNGDIIYAKYGQPVKMEPVIPSQIFDNVPLHGFKLVNMVRRWTTKNVVWRLDDPRGFQVEISSHNLGDLIENVGISKNGVILQRCVWLRDGSQNYLAAEGTPEWDKFVEHTG